jgi:hypothetical protein
MLRDNLREDRCFDAKAKSARAVKDGGGRPGTPLSALKLEPPASVRGITADNLALVNSDE